MNLNDPFGRMEARQQRDYASLCASLRKAGVTRREQARELRDNLGKRCRVFIAVAVVLTLVLALLFPQGQLLIVALGGLFVLWVINATRNGQRYVTRYIEEELEE